MDPECSLQDVVRCHLCETPEPPLHCDLCDIHLCKGCEGKHISNKPEKHKVVPFKLRGCITKCEKHSSKFCFRFCEQCTIPICEQCSSSEKHRDHDFVDVVRKLESQKRVLQRDLQDLENSIRPKYQEIALSISVQKTDLNENSQKLTEAINKYGEDFHREIDNMIRKIKSDLNEIECNNLVVLDKEEDEIKHTICKIKQNIDELNNLLISNDISIISAYKSKNAEFGRLPLKPTVSLPRFTPQNINKEKFYQQFGSSVLSMETSNRPFIDEPRVVSVLKTDYIGFRGVSCLGIEDIWTCGDGNILKLYNLHGELVRSIKTKSGRSPRDIAVTGSGELIYIDDRTVNMVKNTLIETVIRLQGWTPLHVCSTIRGDILVVMIRDDQKQTKAVRYSGSTAKQIIQYNDEGKPLFSRDSNMKYITENKNLDICVADQIANAVVVVNQAGELRFTYKGRPSTTPLFLDPIGIHTDSQSRILISDCAFNGIHIVDQDGQFLRYFDNCGLQYPCALCVNTRDDLIVAETYTGKMKRIQYLL